MALIYAQTWYLVTEVHLEIQVTAGYRYLRISRRVNVTTSLTLPQNEQKI